ncbi:NADase-type glycan-binding domain-containing protein [Leptospira jelokensis]|uniref:NADase-type glycan-binding domain-containing protein n=1 Tax=Leptospira jelokensis TaxID=2484931 RepID=UPI001090E8AF|nr:hypothetical protein [Leptospira jelokensis]TGM04890.1 hypothetical protein EHQ79_02405 [Leptospira jelokensis]
MKKIFPLTFLSLILIFCSKSEEKANVNLPKEPTPNLTASSFLKEGKSEYPPVNIMDNSSLPRCVNSKDTEPSFEITFNDSVKIKYLHLLNGFAKGSLFKMNSRIAKLTLSIDNNQSIDFDIPDSVEYLKTLDKELSGKSFKFVIKNRYEGEKYTDLCLTELSFQARDFNGDLNYNAFCSELFSDFKYIQLLHEDNYITLTQDNKISAYRSPAQMDIKNEGKGIWKIINEHAYKFIEGKYKITLVQNLNDDITSNESKIETKNIEGEFSIPFETDKNCKILGVLEKFSNSLKMILTIMVNPLITKFILLNNFHFA